MKVLLTSRVSIPGSEVPPRCSGPSPKVSDTRPQVDTDLSCFFLQTPPLTDDEIITISGAEAEVRKEMERGALMLKLKAKLEERNKDSPFELLGT